MRTEIRPLVPCLVRPPDPEKEGSRVDPRIIQLIMNFPKGSELLVLRFLILLTEGKGVSYCSLDYERMTLCAHMALPSLLLILNESR